MGPKQQEWKYPGYAVQDRLQAAQDRSGHYSAAAYSNSSGQAGQSGRTGHDLPYNASDPVLGTDMTQGEWDTLRSLLRKAEDGGKMNELMTVHRKEVKNAPMNRNYPPDTEEWQECDDNAQQPVQPVTSPKVLGPASTSANSSTSVHGNAKGASTGTGANESKGPWKVPPIAPPEALKRAMEKEKDGSLPSGWKDWKGWQHYYNPNDDPWVTDDQDVEEVKKQENKKPILQLYGNVVQSNADAAAAKAAAAAVDAMAQRAASDSVGAAGFPSPTPTPPPPPAKSSAPASAAALGSELLQAMVKGKGKDDKGKGKGKEFDQSKGKEFDKGKGKDDKGKGKGDYGKDGKGSYGKGGSEKGTPPGFSPQKPDLQIPVGKSGERPAKCVRIEEVPETQDDQNSQNSANKMPESGAMTDGSKRRHEAVSDSEDDGSFSVVTETGNSPPIFPSLPYGLPSTFKWKDSWDHPVAEIDYEEVDFAIPKPAWIRDTYEWSCTVLKMGKYESNRMSYHTFVEKVFNKSPQECKYAKKMIGQFRKKVTATPRTQGPDLCGFLLHCRVDVFLNAGYVYERDFEWR